MQTDGGLEFVTLQNGRSRARVCTYAAHVLELTLDGEPVLFVSRDAVFAKGKAIRGGIPVIWPQFSGRGPLPSHGFARVSQWTVAQASAAKLVLELQDSEDTRKQWPFGFVARYTVELLEAGLRLDFHVAPKDKDLSFTFALHTYFAIPDITKAEVLGLEGVTYQDQLAQLAERVQEAQGVRFASEVDRVYMAVPRNLAISDGTGRVVNLHTSPELCDAVVWNPWIDKSIKMADFGDDEYQRMVCVEVGVVARPVNVSVGSTWNAVHTISLGKKAGL